MGAPVIIPQRNVPVQDPDSPHAFSLPWYRFLQQLPGSGVDISALEAEIAAVAAEASAASATASTALAEASAAIDAADSALLIALVDLGDSDG